MDNLKEKYIKQITKNGAGTLSDKELLEFLLTFSSNDEASAEKLFAKYGTLKAILDQRLDDLKNNDDLSEMTAVLLKLIPVMCSEKAVAENNFKTIGSADIAKKYFSDRFIGASEEVFMAVCVNKNFGIVDKYSCRSGSRLNIQVNMRELIKFALRNESRLMIIAHNHPDGKPFPSKNDIFFTQRLVKALRPIEVALVDHIIVGKNSSSSMREYSYNDIFDIIEKYEYNAENEQEILQTKVNM